MALTLSAADLVGNTSLGVDVERDTVVLSPMAPIQEEAAMGRDREEATLVRFGLAESLPVPLAEPSAVLNLRFDGTVTPDSRLEVEARADLGVGSWGEWRDASSVGKLVGATRLQVRARLVSEAVTDVAAGPWLRSVTLITEPVSLVRAAQVGPTNPAPPTLRLWATRIGLVGRTTANGHVIAERDHFVALPSRRVLNRQDGHDYRVQLSYRGRTTIAPVWDVGPWNTRDDYWNDAREGFGELPRWTSQAEAAFFGGHNGGRDGSGRFITVPTSIDLADGTFWDALGMSENDWLDVTFLWMDTPSPPQRPTPPVAPRIPPSTAPVGPTGPGGPPAPSVQAAAPLVQRAAAYNLPSPSTRAYLPLVMLDAGGWSTSVSVQNTTESPTSGAIELFKESGGRAGQLSFDLPPHGSRTLRPDDSEGPTAGFVGSGVVTATGAVAVVATTDRPGADIAAYEAVCEGSTSLVAPLVFGDYNGWSTSLQVQNLGAVAANVQVAYQGAGGPVGLEMGTIAPFASRAFSPTAAGIPAGFAGAATVRSTGTQPIGLVANNVRADGSASAYTGLGGTGSPRLQAPLLYKRYNGWDTGVRLFNLGAAPVSASLRLDGGGGASAETATIPANNAATLYQPGQGQAAPGFAGSGVVLTGGNGRLLGVVNGTREGTAAGTSYTLGQSAATTLAVPLLAKDDEWNGGLQVVNPGSTPTTLTVSLYDESGIRVYRTEESLAAGGVRTLYLPALAEVPMGFVGSAILQASSGGGLSGVANQTSR